LNLKNYINVSVKKIENLKYILPMKNEVERKKILNEIKNSEQNIIKGTKYLNDNEGPIKEKINEINDYINNID